MNGRIAEDQVPYFCWDRSWTVAGIRRRLTTSSEQEWVKLMAWIMRESTPIDWHLLENQVLSIADTIGATC
jgi:hypothetical protein